MGGKRLDTDFDADSLLTKLFMTAESPPKS